MNTREFLVKAQGKTAYELWRMSNRLQGRRFVHFLHIGKTGGSAVKYALESNRVTDQYAIILHNHEKTLAQVPVGEYTFFFLRDPVARFVSAFQARLREDRPRYYYPWSPGERLAFEEFQTPNDLAVALASNDRDKRARATAAMHAINHVNQPYAQWFTSPDELQNRAADILFVGFQESLAADFELLKTHLGLSDSLQLPSDPVAANRSTSERRVTLSDQAMTNLKAWYARDFRLLDACKKLRARKDAR